MVRLLYPLSVMLLMSCGSQPATPPATTAVPDTTKAPAQELNGPQVIHLKEGGRMEGMMRQGKRVGSWLSFHPNGVIWSRSVYVDGKEHGPTEVFHDNGSTFYSGAYNAGQPSGEWIFYDPQGKETKRVAYDSNGSLIQP